MTSIVRRFTAIACLLLAAGARAETVAGLPVHLQELAPGVVRVWVGDTVSSTATVAIATADGLVVIDTTGHPRVDAELRRIIARQFGRDDFRYLINTHEHEDHTGGNGVYADCTIVGHELVAAGMAAQAADRARLLEWSTRRIGELEQQLAALPADSVATRQRAQEELTIARLSREDRQSTGAPVPPTRTFADRDRLELGDTVIELYYIGGMHSASDIAVFVPRCGLLLTGDTMADTWLTDTPGCLASFTARTGVRHDFPMLLRNWDALLARRDEIRQLVPGHWNGELSFAGFAARVDYVRTLWDGLGAAADAGRDVGDVFREYALRTRFPQLVEARGFAPRFHEGTLQEMWAARTGQAAAADRLFTLIAEGAAPEALREVVAARGERPARYFYLERQFIARGYEFLQTGRIPQSVAMFRLAVEVFPDAWNAHDSLGEALLAAGDPAGATREYERSLELNPENTNGREALARIRGGGSDS